MLSKCCNRVAADLLGNYKVILTQVYNSVNIKFVVKNKTFRSVFIMPYKSYHVTVVKSNISSVLMPQ